MSIAQGTPKTVLMIGDSLTVGKFGKAVASELNKSPELLNFHQFGAWGSKPKDWAEKNVSGSTEKYVAPGYCERSRDKQYTLSPFAEGILDGIVRAVAPRSLYPTEISVSRLPEHLKNTNPDTVVIALGTNLMDLTQNILQGKDGAQENDLVKEIENLLGSIKLESGKVPNCLWIGPPPLKKWSADVQEKFYQVLRSTVAKPTSVPHCEILDSREIIKTYPSVAASENDDGVHYFKGAGPQVLQDWGKATAEWIKKKIASEP